MAYTLSTEYVGEQRWGWQDCGQWLSSFDCLVCEEGCSERQEDPSLSVVWGAVGYVSIKSCILCCMAEFWCAWTEREPATWSVRPGECELWLCVAVWTVTVCCVCVCDTRRSYGHWVEAKGGVLTSWPDMLCVVYTQAWYSMWCWSLRNVWKRSIRTWVWSSVSALLMLCSSIILWDSRLNPHTHAGNYIIAANSSQHCGLQLFLHARPEDIGAHFKRFP